MTRTFGSPPIQPPVAGATSPSRAWLYKILIISTLVGLILAVAGVTAIFYRFSKDLPKIITVADYRPHVVSQVIASGGKAPAVIGEFMSEQRRYLVPYEKIPQSVVRAFTCAEDDRFFEHSGINVWSIIRASIANFRAGHVVQGGSTITQQVAKSLLLTPEKSFGRKIKEVLLSYQIEKHLTKQQILYLYLNEIYLGHNAYGVQAAAREYFRKDVSELTVAEAALLAGLPQAPGKYSPLLNPMRAKERQRYVLRRMMENGFLTRAQMVEAGDQKLRIYDEENVNTQYSAYLVEQIRRFLVEKYGPKAVNEEGLVATVPTSPELMRTASRSLRAGLEAVDKRNGYRGAIKKLKETDEIEKALKQLRQDLIKRKFHHVIFMPEGKIDAIEVMKQAGLSSDAQLLDKGEVYPAVVTSVDDQRKSAGVMIGATLAELPFERMKWARPAKDEKNPNLPRPEPKVASKVVSRGDMILVRIEENGEKGVVVSLEQEPEVQGAILSIDSQTGLVLAMEGGYDYEKSQFNRALQAQRQPGSSFKPVIYTAAVERGYTPASIIVDSPIVYEDTETGKWKPSNFEERFYGDTTFRQALIKSRNIPTIKIMQSLQIPYVIDFARRLGFTSQLPQDLSISLGSAPASLAEMTALYALYPRLGRKLTPIYFTKVVDRDGKVLEEHAPVPIPSVPAIPAPSPVPQAGKESGPPPNPVVNSAIPVVPHSKVYIPKYPLASDPDQVLDPRVAYIMTHLMKEVVAYGTGHAAQELGHPAAGKTGTTSDYIDAWFMGFTAHVVTGVWVGYDNHRSIGTLETGAKAALPIWLNFMKEAVKTYPNEDFAVPTGVVFESIDPVSGKLAAPNSPNSIKEAFIDGTQPTETAEKGSGATDTKGNFFKEEIE